MGRLAWLGVPLAALACVVEVDHRRSGGAPPPSTPPPTQPLLVVVDTDKTMNATGGDGVGVFVEYRAGGTWHLWWSCDTNKSGLSCSFDIKMTALSGTIRNVKPDRLLTSDKVAENADGSLQATAMTATNVAGVFFDADPGAHITVDATLAGVPKSGDYLFFVQDGKINGGYMGKLTNPLSFKPSAP